MLNLRTRFGLLEIRDFDHATLQSHLSASSKSESKSYHFVNAFSLVMADSDESIYQTLNSGVCYCDSRILELYSKVVKSRVHQIRGADFLRSVLLSQDNALQMFIGGNVSSDSSLHKKIEESLKVIINYAAFAPSYTDDSDQLVEEILPAIMRNEPTRVWIALGTPKQDVVAIKLQRLFRAQYYCIGAAMNFLSGTVKECPKFISSIGFEWLFRFVQEPKRLWSRYTSGNFKFIELLARDLWKRAR